MRGNREDVVTMLDPLRRAGQAITPSRPSDRPQPAPAPVAAPAASRDRIQPSGAKQGQVPAAGLALADAPSGLAADVQALHAATLGRTGTNEQAVLAVLTKHSAPAARQALQQAFQAKYGQTLEAVLNAEMSLTYKTRAISLLKTGQEPTTINPWAYRAEGALDAVDALGTVFQDHPVVASLATGVTLVAAHKYPAAAAALNYTLLATSTARVVSNEVHAARAKTPAERNRYLQQSGRASADLAMSLPGAGPSGLKLVRGGVQTARTSFQATKGTLLARAFRAAKAGAAYRLPVTVVAPLNPKQTAAGTLGKAGDMSDMARNMLAQYGNDMTPAELIEQVNKVATKLGPAKQKAMLALIQDPAFLKQSNGERLARVLTTLGPAHTKLGQVAATKPGLPPKVAEALSRLQDGLEPMSEAMLQERLASAGLAGKYELGKVLGVASMGQVNMARNLRTGEEVCIKFLKPGITHESIQQEFQLMQEVMQPALKRMPARDAADLVTQLKAFETGILEEMDMANEAANMQRFASFYGDHPDFQGIKMIELGADKKALVMSKAPGLSFRKLDPQSAEAKQAASAYLRGIADQVFRNGYYHADPHPGNVFWDPQAAKVTFLDMGAVAEVSPAQRLSLQKTILYVLAKDADHLAKQMVSEAASIDGAAPKAQAKLAAALRTYLDQPGFRMAKIDDHLKAIDAIAKQNGVRPPDQGFWLTKSMITAYGVFKHASGDPDVLRECLPAVMAGLLQSFKQNPAALRTSLADVAAVLGTRLPTLLKSLQELKVLKPELFVMYPGNFLAAINTITQTELAAEKTITAVAGRDHP
jgi:ubiquinone biosynthesis protein